MDTIFKKYTELCNMSSDINEHLPTLFNYAKECESVFETGVRGCISTWALTYGLLNNNKNKKRILLNDISVCNIEEYEKALKNLPEVSMNYAWENNLTLKMDETYDLTFIDTWHVYGQLKRELDKFSKITNKYIIMHDTTVDAVYGESIRQGMDYVTQSKYSGIPIEEILKGLWPAVEEFLQKNPDWVLKERYTNCNGLTVLEKK